MVYGDGQREGSRCAVAAGAGGRIFAPASISDAINLAANQLLLCDPGRPQANGAKQKGSVHGDSVGLHASDSANAWRNIAKVSNARNTIAASGS